MNKPYNQSVSKGSKYYIFNVLTPPTKYFSICRMPCRGVIQNADLFLGFLPTLEPHLPTLKPKRTKENDALIDFNERTLIDTSKRAYPLVTPLVVRILFLIGIRV